VATVVDLYVDQGSEFTYQFLYRQADETTVIPLSGYTGKFQVRDYDGNLLHEGTVVDYLTIDGPNGKVTITIPGSVSSDWEVDEAQYDVEVYDPSATPYRIVEGTVFVDPEVTT